MPYRPTTFRPAWWLRNGHAQTLWPSLMRQPPRFLTRSERLELPDGDFLDLNWTLGSGRPLVIVLHGLEGSFDSHYVRGLLAAIHAQGWRGVLMHFRNCSGAVNRLARSYHAGETGDFDFLVKTLSTREPETPLAAVGYSLGGNALLKWLGERGAESPLRAAVAVSVPFELAKASRHMMQGFPRIYQNYLLSKLKRSAYRKFSQRFQETLPVHELKQMRTLWEFDHRATAPLHGFQSAEHYYQSSSSRPYLRTIQTPTLILHAQDDPFMIPEVIPTPAELAEAVELELIPCGGHVGFVSGSTPWTAEYWLESRIPHYLTEQAFAENVQNALISAKR